MGQPKLLMTWGRQTILESTVSSFLDSTVSETIAVLGHKARELRKVIGNLPVKIVVNHDYGKGMGTSLVCAVKTTNSHSQGIMLVLADQPSIDFIQLISLSKYLRKDRKVL